MFSIIVKHPRVAVQLSPGQTAEVLEALGAVMDYSFYCMLPHKCRSAVYVFDRSGVLLSGIPGQPKGSRHGALAWSIHFVLLSP